jgi:hypothetical protein
MGEIVKAGLEWNRFVELQVVTHCGKTAITGAQGHELVRTA